MEKVSIIELKMLGKFIWINFIIKYFAFPQFLGFINVLLPEIPKLTTSTLLIAWCLKQILNLFC